MRTVNVHEAKTHLSKLLAAVGRGETVIVARAGVPVARLVPIEGADTVGQRVGFMPDLLEIPDDFDRMGADDIERLFGSAS
ncbi:type II toxin-antitoxin system Phd/YefM family antitoxin [Demequina silvatica]|uniref:type II toxin-antitoxin system Phd/YefM family antitoxin n=1 Tax=Demequina silvatica TaxID=1638988 RepID=UPI0007814CDC|nr:type II toxin-antitoxin system prevent-host-death family antitoxin [Demequina silvatica]